MASDAWLERYREWVGRSEQHHDVVTAAPLVALAALLPRRMWAGSRLEFLRPLVVGARVTRTSMIRDVVPKVGRSGALVFVTVRHEVSEREGVVLTDEHDIVYRGESVAATTTSPT